MVGVGADAVCAENDPQEQVEEIVYLCGIAELQEVSDGFVLVVGVGADAVSAENDQQEQVEEIVYLCGIAEL